MIDIDEWTITQAVLKVQAGTQDARLRRVLDSLVRHLHDFAREVELTEAEWAQGIDFLTRVGHITDDRRQEFILLSDVMGLSTLVTAQNNRRPAGCTEATVFGPFYVPDAPACRNGDDIANGARGQPCFVSGTVRGIGGEPVAGATIAVWQSDEDGTYDVQRPGLDHAEGRGRLASAADGRYHFRSILAVPYPIPHDGPVGQLLERTGRHPWRPAHLHFMIQAPGYETLVTHVFRAGDEYLESDAVFGVRSSLVADWQPHGPGTAPDGTRMDTPFHTLDYDFVLNPAAPAPQAP
ncbi:intradiol ring-cleavage dioxygenase [Paracidovorax cattleyae]|uniref:Catechol 1,2-dioxygenase n=1 Tax=Paracidovorax cattleyae TaxID=80868 RepID=A0A1H0MP81_9BURK|nr:intradiol ring-cleavage dioxygenase [Paracidovorax cattleyae]AVS75764.1 hydroxyquinol 1,2-dioxygenase [Paracidovorax cattleyae]MBF9265809.1 intradiol ring-cleavage dioxygenase [Paracidovorax cattleyae]SDO82263.1 catechol 1,2-dioxygenase [Paracidovorax cattleyae]